MSMSVGNSFLSLAVALNDFSMKGGVLFSVLVSK